MWLLNVQPRRLEWVEMRRACLEGYAILSHTWEDEEVSFQDMEDPSSARRLKGYEKIRFACNEALVNGIPWVWIDTCCIDKKSSAELSEAINSMFQFYWKSRVCYVYLSDVSKPSESAWNPERPDPTILGHSRWFKRGWTLQELIAPYNVQFFSKDWWKMGTKSTLGTCLAKITGIDLQVLRRREFFREYGVAQRMSWAAGRATTRSEDRAYSLLGLFDVNMPLVYGEGKKAFQRLQHEIMKASDDQSIFLWDALCSNEDEYNILASSPDCFVNARRIVPIRNSSYRPFELTNSGLQIPLHVRITTKGTSLVFNCRYVDDFRGPIAMDTHALGPSNHGIGTHDHSRYALERHLEVVPLTEVGGIKLVNCLLVNRRNGLEARARRAIESSHWFRLNEIFSSSFTLHAVFPLEAWNPESSVMQQRTRGPVSTLEPSWGYITWKGSSEASFVTLMFKSLTTGNATSTAIATLWTERPLSTTECQRWADDTPKPTMPIQILSLGINDNDDEPPQFIERKDIAYPRPGRLSFSAENRLLFGEWVCIIDVSLYGVVTKN